MSNSSAMIMINPITTSCRYALTLIRFIALLMIVSMSAPTTGSNRKSAWLSGINVRIVEFSVYVINGLMSALVGIVLTSTMTLYSIGRPMIVLPIDM